MSATHSCPALFISAPASNQGKTTVTAALARHHRRQGKRVRVFKTGPDFLDPMILARASGQPVYSLHLWMVGETACRRLLFEAAHDADLILVEGVMGLFDGKPSGADLARAFGLPVLAVIDAQAMAQTFGALAHGLATYQPDLPFHGVFANRVNAASHANMLVQSLPPTIRWCGHLAPDAGIALPDRHLGLTQADEIDDLDARLDQAADAIAATPLAEMPAPVVFKSAKSPDGADASDVAATDHDTARLDGLRIAIARDAAFSFIYPANIDFLHERGAEVVYFSPLRDEVIPAGANLLYLPGGYPELHAATLHAASATGKSIRQHIAANRPTLAECGGMLYLLDGLVDIDGVRHTMLGELPGEAIMQTKLGGLGMHRFTTPLGDLTGHTFHYSSMQSPLVPHWHTRHATRDSQGEAVYRRGPITASYHHAYWPSNPSAAVALLRATL